MRVLLLLRQRLLLLRPLLLSTIPIPMASSSNFNFRPQLLIFASQLSPHPSTSSTNSNSNFYSSSSSSTTTTLCVNLTHPKPYKPSSSSSSLTLSCVAVAAAVAVTTVAPPPPPPPNKNKEKKNKKKTPPTTTSPPTPKPRSSSSSKDAAQLKLNWLSSLSLSLPLNTTNTTNSSSPSSSLWVIGIDPDVSGALALFKPPNHATPQVFDNPHLKLLVGKRTRRRLDPKSIIQLLQSLDAPAGTTAYLEQSTPFPTDGKLGWWGGGFNYGLWIGALVASGFSVVPVPPSLWKNHFKLSGNGSSKDDSREAACKLFPSISSQLTRKKDHGRAEALLIAAYGKGLNVSPCSPLVSEDTIP